MRRSLLAATTALLVLAVASLYSPSALAQPDPVQVDPPEDAVLTEAPGLVTMQFSEALARDTDATGVTLRREGTTSEIHPLYEIVDPNDPTHLAFSPPPNLTAGRYVVSWRATSAETGETSEGEYALTIDPDAVPTASVGGEGPDPLQLALITLGGLAGGTFLGLLAYLFRRAIAFGGHPTTEGTESEHH